MKNTWRVAIVAALGLCLALYVFLHIGFGTVVAAVARTGFGGFGLLCVYGLAMSPLLAAAWFVLLPGGSGYFGVFVWARMVREAAGDLLSGVDAVLVRPPGRAGLTAARHLSARARDRQAA